MSNTAWSDDQITTATMAAARAMYAKQRKALVTKAGADPDGWPEDFDGLDQATRNQIVDVAIPIVWAALTALPDIRREAWTSGFVAAKMGDDVIDNNPYPMETP